MIEYHIHVNALSISEASEINLRGCGFGAKPFDFSVQNTSYSPVKHYSFKSMSERDFEYSFVSAKNILRNDVGFIGYVEGEFVQFRHEIMPVNSVTIRRRPLFKLELMPPRSWRAAEVHAVCEYGAELTNILRSAGFYQSAMYKSGVLFEVSTAQGDRKVITDLYLFLKDYCDKYSPNKVSIKLEILIHSFASDKFNWLPAQAVGRREVEEG